MQLEVNDEERGVVRHALETYLSDLREEIVKTKKHEWLQVLHREEQALKNVVERLSPSPN